jgi:hypothetical protein
LLHIFTQKDNYFKFMFVDVNEHVDKNYMYQTSFLVYG